MLKTPTTNSREALRNMASGIHTELERGVHTEPRPVNEIRAEEAAQESDRIDGINHSQSGSFIYDGKKIKKKERRKLVKLIDDVYMSGDCYQIRQSSEGLIIEIELTEEFVNEYNLKLMKVGMIVHGIVDSLNLSTVRRSLRFMPRPANR